MAENVSKIECEWEDRNKQ